jgi:uncharacterized protein (DUF2147 family)
MKIQAGVRLAGCLLAPFLWQAMSFDATASSFIEGTWRIDNLVLEIFSCDKLVCGQIVWIGDSARRPSQCGRTIVWGLKSTSPSEWTDGSILDPDDGATYSLSARYQRDGTLRARIFRGIELIGRTKILNRVPLRSLAGWC